MSRTKVVRSRKFMTEFAGLIVILIRLGSWRGVPLGILRGTGHERTMHGSDSHQHLASCFLVAGTPLSFVASFF